MYSTSLHDESIGVVHHNHGVGSSSSPLSSGGFIGLINIGLCKEEFPMGCFFPWEIQNIGSTNFIWHKKLLMIPSRLSILLGTFSGSYQFNIKQ